MNWVSQSTLIKFVSRDWKARTEGTSEGMLEAPQPPGGNWPGEDPTLAMQRIIDQALDLVPPADVLTTQDEAALARLTGFISTVAGAMWDISSSAGDALGSGAVKAAG